MRALSTSAIAFASAPFPSCSPRHSLDGAGNETRRRAAAAIGRTDGGRREKEGGKSGEGNDWRRTNVEVTEGTCLDYLWLNFSEQNNNVRLRSGQSCLLSSFKFQM